VQPWLWAVELRAARSRTIYTRPVVRFTFRLARHNRTPRRYRGKDFAYWGAALKRPEQIVDTVPVNLRKGAEVLLTGVNGGYDVDLRSMARRGIVLLSHSKGIKDANLMLAEDMEQHLTKGDEAFESFKKSVDEYVTKNGLDLAEEQQSEVSPNITKEISSPVSHLTSMRPELVQSSGRADSATTSTG
jgi:putative flavoprotein involved in K+ transport